MTVVPNARIIRDLSSDMAKVKQITLRQSRESTRELA